MSPKCFSLLILLSLFLSCLSKSPEVTFDSLLKRLKITGKPKILAVAGAGGQEVLKSVRAAKDMGIADSILFGDRTRIKKIAEEINIDISDFKIYHSTDEIETTRAAVKFVHDELADMYVKGTINTKDVLKAALDKEIGLRTGKSLSNVSVFEVKGLHRMLLLTDPAVVPYPTLEEKVRLINNAVEVAHACGIENPKVAPLAAVEVFNPKMPETVEAAELTKMNERGEIKGCIVDGPMSFDLSVDPAAARLKGTLNRKITGDADILLFPNIHGANFVYKLLTHVATSKNGNIIVGTSRPCVFSSRSDSFETRLNSLILASIYVEYQNSMKEKEEEEQQQQQQQQQQ